MMWALLVNLATKLAPLLMGPLGTFVSGINLMSVFTNLKQYWRFYLPVILISLMAATAFGWSQDHNALRAERVAHATDIKTYKDAQATAKIEAEQEQQKLAQDGRIKADEADQNYNDLLARYRASLVRYKATQGDPGPASNSGPEQAAQSPDRPGAGTFISSADIDICTVNTARLQAAHDWALTQDKEQK